MTEALNMWSRPPSEVLRAGPDFDLGALDRHSTPGWYGDKAQGKAFTKHRGDLLSELQERLFADGRAGGTRSVLLIIQGLDTAGKGGIVRHVIGMVDPQGVALHAFGVPTAEEARHHYLWRIRKALPPAGRIGVFDRSHYEDVLVARVEQLVEPDVWEKRYDEINRFEEKLVDGGTTVVKVALLVSRAEQGLRLMERLDRPDKYWKWNPGDVDTRQRWDEYQQAYADVFARTSTDHAPWHVVPSDRKWYSRLAVTELLTRALLQLELDWPRPTWRVDVQRRRLAATMEPGTLEEAAERRPEVLAEMREDEAAFDEAVERLTSRSRPAPVPAPTSDPAGTGAGDTAGRKAGHSRKKADGKKGTSSAKKAASSGKKTASKKAAGKKTAGKKAAPTAKKAANKSAGKKTASSGKKDRKA